MLKNISTDVNTESDLEVIYQNIHSFLTHAVYNDHRDIQYLPLNSLQLFK